MGCYRSEEMRNKFKGNYLVVATLNYGGILNSPLEFFSDSQDE